MHDSKITISNETNRVTTPTACGDGLNKKPESSGKRVPVPSSRKFTARPPSGDKRLRLKLERSIFELTGNEIAAPFCAPPTKPDVGCKLKPRKAKSVAEITPTRIKRKKIGVGERTASAAASEDGAALHATPREAAATAAAEERRRLVGGLVFRRWLLLAWRRNRSNLTALTESSRRRLQQISQLEMQIDVLKNLRKSECRRREEALQDCRQLRNTIDELESENRALAKDKQILEQEAARLEADLDGLRVELGNARNSLERVRDEAKSLERHLEKEREKLKRKREERIALLDTISKKEEFIKIQNESMSNLEAAVGSMSKQIQDLTEDNKLMKNKYKELLLQSQIDTTTNKDLEKRLERLAEDKGELEIMVETLQNELSGLVDSFDHLKAESEANRTNLLQICEQQKSWWVHVKVLAGLSFVVVRKIAYDMLPALPKEF